MISKKIINKVIYKKKFLKKHYVIINNIFYTFPNKILLKMHILKSFRINSKRMFFSTNIKKLKNSQVSIKSNED